MLFLALIINGGLRKPLVLSLPLPLNGINRAPISPPITLKFANVAEFLNEIQIQKRLEHHKHETIAERQGTQQSV